MAKRAVRRTRGSLVGLFEKIEPKKALTDRVTEEQREAMEEARKWHASMRAKQKPTPSIRDIYNVIVEQTDLCSEVVSYSQFRNWMYQNG